MAYSTSTGTTSYQTQTQPQQPPQHDWAHNLMLAALAGGALYGGARIFNSAAGKSALEKIAGKAGPKGAAAYNKELQVEQKFVQPPIQPAPPASKQVTTITPPPAHKPPVNKTTTTQTELFDKNLQAFGTTTTKTKQPAQKPAVDYTKAPTSTLGELANNPELWQKHRKKIVANMQTFASTAGHEALSSKIGAAAKAGNDSALMKLIQNTPDLHKAVIKLPK